MADYWKSQPKYYCTACNCYMADNKVTRDRHEGGKNHQENVERRLKEIRFKALQDEREKRLLDNCMKKMNEGAAKSMGTSGNVDANAATAVAVASAPTVATEATPSGYKRGDLAPANAASVVAPTDDSQDWKESKTADGRVYYWNTKTKETVWEKPKPRADPNADGSVKPAVKSTKIRVLGSSAASSNSPTVAAAAANAAATAAPMIGAWTSVAGPGATEQLTKDSSKTSGQTPKITERVLPEGSMKRSTDTEETCTFKTKKPRSERQS